MYIFRTWQHLSASQQSLYSTLSLLADSFIIIVDLFHGMKSLHIVTSPLSICFEPTHRGSHMALAMHFAPQVSTACICRRHHCLGREKTVRQVRPNHPFVPGVFSRRAQFAGVVSAGAAAAAVWCSFHQSGGLGFSLCWCLSHAF